jgi:hypothetical protein
VTDGASLQVTNGGTNDEGVDGSAVALGVARTRAGVVRPTTTGGSSGTFGGAGSGSGAGALGGFGNEQAPTAASATQRDEPTISMTYEPRRPISLAREATSPGSFPSEPRTTRRWGGLPIVERAVACSHGRGCLYPTCGSFGVEDGSTRTTWALLRRRSTSAIHRQCETEGLKRRPVL